MKNLIAITSIVFCLSPSLGFSQFSVPGGTISNNSPATHAEFKAAASWNGTIRANSPSGYSSFGLYEADAMRWAFYHHPAVSNSLLFANASGQDKFAFSQSGNLGIDHIGPQVKLDIGNSHGNGLQFRYDQTTNYRIRLTPYWNSNADTRLDFNIERSAGAGFTTVMSAGYNNNVGVGTITPEGKFTITQIGNGWNDGLRINRDASNYLTLTEDVTDVRLKNWGSGGLLFYTSSTLAAAITNNGNVGIGAAVPEQKLDVRGNLVLEAGTNPVLYTGTGSAEQNRFLQLINSTPYGSASGLKAGGVLIADTYAYGNPGKNDLIVKGSIGIGTVTPGSYKLAVEGKIGAREVNVTTNAWSDYVFNADYQLRPLAEVQQFIEENHHLPEVPSEKEVFANGQNLGEMNAILLKKIEELTLYVIELKTQNDRTMKLYSQQVEEIEKLKSLMEKSNK